VEFTNQLREQGMEMVDALVKAASQRLRPILMTTGAMVLGAVPLALAHGAGAEAARRSAGDRRRHVARHPADVFVVPTITRSSPAGKCPGRTSARRGTVPTAMGRTGN